jgi:hypothetical protein
VDLGETTDLAGTKSETVRQLGSSVDAWNSELIPPAFPGLGARQAAKKDNGKGKGKERSPD